ncbi:hypothetical protein PFISCL1PPCAC_22194, partial [Pristionchus fissidentatus]
SVQGELGSMLQNSTPSQQHASALSLLRLLTMMFNTPSAQVFGAISDLFRGDSGSALDRFSGLQKTFLCTWPISAASSIFFCCIIKFYRNDVEKRKKSIIGAGL